MVASKASFIQCISSRCFPSTKVQINQQDLCLRRSTLFLIRLQNVQILQIQFFSYCFFFIMLVKKIALKAFVMRNHSAGADERERRGMSYQIINIVKFLLQDMTDIFKPPYCQRLGTAFTLLQISIYCTKDVFNQLFNYARDIYCII